MERSASTAISKERVLAEIRRTANENDGVPLGKGRFAKETGIRESDWAGRHWVRWGDALREAGFEPNQLQGRIPDDVVLKNLMLLTSDLGRLPTENELRMRRREEPSFPNSKVFARLGSKVERARKLAAYCANRDGGEDVFKIASSYLEEFTEDEPASPGSEPPKEWGFVYLLKSGRHYKVGRSISADRRERELQIQLPERATRVHVIQTDDPVGIERYWHQRFADRRKNGEWFELTKDDVSAFRRRKFM